MPTSKCFSYFHIINGNVFEIINNLDVIAAICFDYFAPISLNVILNVIYL